MIKKACVLKVFDKYITKQINLSENFEDALIIENKRKAKAARKTIIKLTKGLTKPEIVEL